MDKVIEFINRRFPIDSNWKDGNCYHFALILADVFNGEIYYDVIVGHFITKILGKYYDYSGVVENYNVLIKWDKFWEYDEKQFYRIIRDCIN